MLRIGEFSRLARVSVRMLRHYDGQGLLKPARVDGATGYRLYEVGQLAVVQKIALLRDLGFTVAEIQEAVENWDAQFLRERLLEKEREMEHAVAEGRRRLERLRFALDELTFDPDGLTYDVTVKPVPEYIVLSCRDVVDDYYCEKELWERLSGSLPRYRPEMPGTPIFFSICHDEGYKERDVDLEVCVVVKRPLEPWNGVVCRRIGEVRRMASLMVIGGYEKLAPAYRAFAHFLEKDEGFRLSEISRQVYHVGPWNESDPEKYITEIQMPLYETTFP